MRMLCLALALSLVACDDEPAINAADATARIDASYAPDVAPDLAPDTSIDVSSDVSSDVAPDVSPDVSDSGAPDVDTRPRMPVRFALRPSWEGVRAVEVIGAFGRADDWTRPFAVMALDGDTWRAAGELPVGTYPYAFRAVGDALAGDAAATLSRYVHDPANLRSGRCPTGSTLAMMREANPCAILFVPQSEAAPQRYALTGRAVLGASPAAGWIAVVERAGPAEEPFFVDRTVTDADGRFALSVALGTYRVVLSNPTALSAPATARSLATASAFVTMAHDFREIDVTAAR